MGWGAGTGPGWLQLARPHWPDREVGEGEKEGGTLNVQVSERLGSLGGESGLGSPGGAKEYRMLGNGDSR